MDNLDGALYQRLAGAPNSVLVIDGSATVLAWSHVTDPRAVSRVLDDLAAAHRGCKPLSGRSTRSQMLWSNRSRGGQPVLASHATGR